MTAQHDFEEEPYKPRFSHARFGYFTVILIFLGYQFAGSALLSLFAHSGSKSVSAFIQGLGQVLFMLIPSMVVMQYSPLKIKGLMRSGGAVSAAQWLLGVLGVVAMQVFVAGYAGLQEHLMPEAVYPWYKYAEDLIENAYKTLLGGSTPSDAARALVVGAVIPAFAEEILFRGVLQRSLEQVHSPLKAILVTACIFGILHLNLTLIIPLVCIGAYLGFLAYYTQSLGLAVVAHFANNALAIVALYMPEHNASSTPDTAAWQYAALMALGAVGLVSVVLLLVRYTAQQQPSLVEPEDNDEY